jgi:hypothetical protein
MILELLLNVSKALFGLGGAMKAAKRQQRARIAELLDNISECVGDTAQQLRTPKPDGSPWYRCKELNTYGVELANVLAGVLPNAKSEELGMQLRQATTARGVLTELAEVRDATAGPIERENSCGHWKRQPVPFAQRPICCGPADPTATWRTTTTTFTKTSPPLSGPRNHVD